MALLQRHGYINTRSSAGKPVVLTFQPEHVLGMRCWVNSNGNPSYTYVIRHDGGTVVLYSVDDYGAENNLSHVSIRRVKRKGDLFAGWL